VSLPAKQLPDKQRQILEFIRSTHDATGVYPSVREIAAHMDFKSTNTVDYHLRRMESAGVLERNSRRARSFAVSNDTGRSGSRRRAARVQDGIPILGRVAAGAPILAEQHLDGLVSLSSYFPCDESTFALRVQGDSMIDAGIVEGDLVIVRHHVNVSNGEIGVAVIDGEATVKRVYDEGTHWRLQPENERLQPVRIKKGSAEFSLAGKVVGVVRKI
jgi:repressor LexA